jgi:hypothetical protein
MTSRSVEKHRANPWGEFVTALTSILVPATVFGNDKMRMLCMTASLFPLSPEPEFRALNPNGYQEPDQTERWANENELYHKKNIL